MKMVSLKRTIFNFFMGLTKGQEFSLFRDHLPLICGSCGATMENLDKDHEEYKEHLEYMCPNRCTIVMCGDFNQW